MHQMQLLLAQCRWPALADPYDRALREAVTYILTLTEPLGILAAGTILRSQPSPSSDLDLYVIHAQPRRKRIQKLFGSPPPNSPLPGVPAEIFINPVQAVEGYLKEEQEDATPMTAHMLATGFVVLEQDPIIADLRGRARALLERPPQAGPQKLTFFRYTAATIYEDAVDMVDANPETAAMILARAVGEMLRFAFHAAGRFLPREKDLLRALEELDPLLAELARSFYRATSLPERLSLAESIAGRTIGVKGFFEWESEYEEVNTRK